jgi:hypothetical protein
LGWSRWEADRTRGADCAVLVVLGLIVLGLTVRETDRIADWIFQHLP